MFRKYGLGGSIRMLFHLLRTRLFYSSARLIRFPFELRNHRYIDLGKGLTTGVGCRLEALPQGGARKTCIRLGYNVQLNDYVHIGAIEYVCIGNNVLIASKVFITDHNHGQFDEPDEEVLLPPITRRLHAKMVSIGDNCWIGENVVILPGVTLGEGCVVGASSVVTKPFPPYTLIIGNPASAYKRYNQTTKKWEKL
ncbi:MULTISPECIES: DapH/DapD/GlmU-related protein [Olivibacter]|uniref:DapH/DapD/GlmU-related protein n=1 Tax=Olivibacter jilunii TaxID=985016 RepID=A0ABW6B9Q5_9SPHI|nr:acetyltransferase [Olivibacter sp. UJ_SKK_5.1]MDX3912637.1 DapH/DapD/GlmU-related protein [Pseudosphingobacterium sp.]